MDIRLKGGSNFFYASDFIISIKRTESDEKLGILNVFKSGKSKEVEKLETGIQIVDEIAKKGVKKEEIHVWSTNNNKTQRK